ncbi:RNA polymerase sigma-70 factor (ECF subfamily) [Anaerobacterium chartisolvens]|uniref:RNA polymerase sigma-70 factor (ECF subfamily) n=1 Tax=Anaerobacterium chartisolvens TaxID=1297424 RepID=A0A369AD99_9FIRM|nr:sigma-70 family RNA polymerase sigma factor [Anaerobacterium chartisolvens]RCX07342.1 RNA polymerase sigma-70 factor (ECF subfamily) [Anaerobacterium chartisolvens]
MLEDKQIIKLCKSGYIDMLEILIDRHKDSLYKFCYHLSQNKLDADDLFQDTWVRTMQSIASCDEERAFSNWLLSIALNAYRDRYRKTKRWLNKLTDFFSNEEKEAALHNAPSHAPPSDEQAVDNELREHLVHCINLLDDTFRIPVILFYFKQMRYEDIAEILDIPVGTVKSRLNSGKSKLRKLMEVEYFE